MDGSDEHPRTTDTTLPPGLENIDTCARCDAPIDRRAWHYTGLVTDSGAEGEGEEVRIRVFCSEACRDRWKTTGE